MVKSYFDALVKEIRLTFSHRSLVWDFSVFASYFLTAKLGQYILFGLHTSPALIWAPSGIALAAVLLRGYSMWLPIMLGYLAAIITLPGYLPPLGIAIVTIGFTLQPLIGKWVLTKMDSNGTVHRTRDVITLVIGSILIAAIGPACNTLGQVILHTLSASASLTFTRAWVGGMLGIIILTPLINGWYYSPYWPIPYRRLPEAINAFCLLGISIYLLFWTALPGTLVFLLIFFLCISLFWIALRFGSRVTVSAFALLTLFGIMGSILAHPTTTPLNQQLFSDELFIILITPIFYIFFTLMEERRLSERELAGKVRELEEITQQLSENDKAKNDFIAILAHELRNPLSTIMNTLELLKLGSLNEDAAEMVELGEQQSQAMRRLLDDLLDVARINEKKLVILPEQVDLSTVIKYCTEASKHRMKDRHHTFTVSIPEQKIILSIDPIRIEQVITNILNNAAKYTPEGGIISLTVSTEKEFVHIKIKDNGRGILKEDLEKIFSPFQQLSPAPHRSSGIGVGLFLTREIVEMHNGTIKVESEGEGKGSTFTVTLPIA